MLTFVAAGFARVHGNKDLTSVVRLAGKAGSVLREAQRICCKNPKPLPCKPGDHDNKMAANSCLERMGPTACPPEQQPEACFNPKA